MIINRQKHERAVILGKFADNSKISIESHHQGVVDLPYRQEIHDDVDGETWLVHYNKAFLVFEQAVEYCNKESHNIKF